MDGRAGGAAPRRPHVSRSLARAAGVVVGVRRASAAARRGRGACRRRQAGRLRALLRPAPLSPDSPDRRRLAGGVGQSGRRGRPRTGHSSIWAAGPGRRAPAGLPAVARHRQSSGSIGIPGRSGRRRRRIGRSASRRGRARATSPASSSRDRRPRCWPPSRSTSSPTTPADRLLHRLIARATDGDRVLIVEPLAGFVAPWWNDWRQAFQAAGGRDDEWRFRVELPAIVAKLDRAAGLNHRELKARSSWLPGR